MKQLELQTKVREHFTITKNKVRARASLKCIINVKMLVGAFNQEKALLGASSVIVNLREPSFEALVAARLCTVGRCRGRWLASCQLHFIHISKFI